MQATINRPVPCYFCYTLAEDKNTDIPHAEFAGKVSFFGKVVCCAKCFKLYANETFVKLVIRK